MPGLAVLRDNPHRCAKLVCLTEPGRATVAALSRMQHPWVDALVVGISAEKTRIAAEIQMLRQLLKQNFREPSN